MRVDSNVDKGSQFSFLIPLTLCDDSTDLSQSPASSQPLSATSHSRGIRSRDNGGSGGHELDGLVGAFQPNHIGDATNYSLNVSHPPSTQSSVGSSIIPITGSTPFRPIQTDTFEMDAFNRRTLTNQSEPSLRPGNAEPPAGPALVAEPHAKPGNKAASSEHPKLRVLIVEVRPRLVYRIKFTNQVVMSQDNDINRRILGKRLINCGHTVVNTANGQEGLDKVIEDGDFDCVLMDLQ